jgi:hypothetical protein
MGATWRFRLVRNDGSSGFVRRQNQFEGTTDEALSFADRIYNHFAGAARRVEAWSVDQVEQERSGRVLFVIERHENKRDWRLLESPLTHPGWFLASHHAVDYAAFRGRGYELEIRISDGSTETVVLAGKAADPFARSGPNQSAGVFHPAG